MVFTPAKEWVPLARTISPTAAATALNNTLTNMGTNVINLGQGREIVELDLLDELTKQEVAKVVAAGGKLISSKYNDPANELSKTAAAWIKRIVGVDSTPSTTFALQQLGRWGLNESFLQIAAVEELPSTAKFLVPDSSWPMVADLLKDNRMEAIKYAMIRGNYAANIRTQLEKHDKDIFGVYVNSPHNPTGQILTAQDFNEIFAVLNEYNSGEALAQRGVRKIGLVMDAPYIHACAQKDGQLQVGLEAFTQDQITPWIIPISSSKFFGAAEPGFTMIAAHSAYAAPLAARLTRTSALAFFPPFFKALVQVLSPHNDGIVLGHFSDVRSKYVANRDTLESAFLSERIVDGDAGMTALLKIKPSDYAGRIMTRHDGTDMPIDDLNDVIEYNGNKHGIVAVNNGFDSEGNALMRLAAAAVPSNYAKGIDSLIIGLAEIKTSPVRAPVPLSVPGVIRPTL